MKAVSTLKPQDWIRDPKTRKVMDALGEGQALFVGGCVRNAILEEAVEDIDIATKHVPDEVVKRLEAAGIKAIPTGIEHGTVTAVVEGKPFEVTTLRKDVETDGRRAVVAFAQDWAEDARRRDFTMNTLLADMDGNIYDPLGGGLEDLKNRNVVFVGEAKQRIAEDHLRILRYFRFHALYAGGEPDSAALAACTQGADQIANLSRERITQEFFKILSAKKAVEVLRLMFDHGVLEGFKLPETDIELLGYVCSFQERYGLGFVASRLLVLAGFEENNLQAMSKFLLVPKVFQKDMKAISEILALPALKDEQAVKVAVYKHGRVPTAQALMIELAQDRVMNGYAKDALDIIQNWDVPDFPVSGEDLIKKGFKAGPELGKELQRLEQEWIEQGL